MNIKTQKEFTQNLQRSKDAKRIHAKIAKGQKMKKEFMQRWQRGKGAKKNSRKDCKGAKTQKSDLCNLIFLTLLHAIT